MLLNNLQALLVNAGTLWGEWSNLRKFVGSPALAGIFCATSEATQMYSGLRVSPAPITLRRARPVRSSTPQPRLSCGPPRAWTSRAEQPDSGVPKPAAEQAPFRLGHRSCRPGRRGGTSGAFRTNTIEATRSDRPKLRGRQSQSTERCSVIASLCCYIAIVCSLTARLIFKFSRTANSNLAIRPEVPDK